MSYKDLQNKAYSIEEDLKVLAVWTDAAKKQISDTALQVQSVSDSLGDAKEDLRDCKTAEIVNLQEYVFLADCVESVTLQLKDLKAQLAIATSKLEQLEAKKPELQKLYADTIKQMEKYDNNVIPFNKANHGRNQKDGTGTT